MIEEAAATSAVICCKTPAWKRYLYGLVAEEISRFGRYYDRLIEVCSSSRDSNLLYEAIDCPKKARIRENEELPDFSDEMDRRTLILLNGTLNYHLDIQELLSSMKPRLSRTSRVAVVVYNFYMSWLYRLANWLGVRKDPVGSTFLTVGALQNIMRLSGFELVRIRPTIYFPWRLLGLGDLINSILTTVPGFRWMGLVSILVIRPIIADATAPTLSIVIPARNERGNIENALKRMPDLGAQLEILFVEGHSNDGTWEEIQRVAREYGTRFRIRAIQQTGKGKNDAVRLGFQHATGDLLTILDADLTMPPEMLGRFYEAYRQGLADFVNGTRLVYPMEGEAMRFLNRVGNIFFAKALSFVLDTPLADSLCGTKLIARHDYQRIVRWRADFGDFDPFGDFELLFPAAILGLGIIDIPIRYRARTYGATSISRFRHGFMLLKMTVIGLFKVRLGGTA